MKTIIRLIDHDIKYIINEDNTVIDYDNRTKIKYENLKSAIDDITMKGGIRFEISNID